MSDKKRIIVFDEKKYFDLANNFKCPNCGSTGAFVLPTTQVSVLFDEQGRIKNKNQLKKINEWWVLCKNTNCKYYEKRRISFVKKTYKK